MNSENWIREYKDRRLWEEVVEYLRKFHNDILEETKIYGGSITKENMIEILLDDIEKITGGKKE